MSTEKENTEVRQEQFAEAALDVVASHGLGGLSIARVAHRVGLVPSAVYRHFAGKDQLLDAAIGLIRDKLLRNVTEVCQGPDDALECLRKLVMRHAQMIRQNAGIMRVVFSQEIFSGQPKRRAFIYEMVKGYLKRVADLVERGQKEGTIRKDLDPNVVAVMFLGLVQPPAILWQLSDGSIDVTRQVAKAWEIFVDAIRHP